MRKYIYWRDDMHMKDGLRFANVHIIGGYDDSLASFNKLAATMRETFPDAPDDKIILGVICESMWVKNMAIVSYNNYIPNGEYPEFEQGLKQPEYRW